MRVSGNVVLAEPEIAVTVIVYVPAWVPGVLILDAEVLHPTHTTKTEAIKRCAGRKRYPMRTRTAASTMKKIVSTAVGIQR